MIFIYDDGIHNNAALMTAIQTSVPNTDVRYCTASTIIDDALDNAQLIIMPGGADLYFCEKLNGYGNQKIKQFVSDGGSYLGICAGAYYACAHLDWNNGEIDGTRELAFYDGTATGPVFDWVENKHAIYNGSWVKAAPLKSNDAPEFSTYYNGGPVFTEPTSDKVTVMARYTSLPDSPPAIIQGTHGGGRYILSSPHIELFGDAANDRLYEHQNKSFQHETHVTRQLAEHQDAQHNYLKKILSRLLKKHD